MNAELKWAIQLASALVGLVTLIETGRKRGWL
jgi:hypothetical protein